MSVHGSLPGWALPPVALVGLALWRLVRAGRRPRGPFGLGGLLEALLGLACLAGAALFLLGRCVP